MKSVTEFAGYTLTAALSAQKALAAEGKSPEEVQAALGEKYKLEGDKLKYFINALDVASKETGVLKRVIVASLNEGEAAPAKSTQVEEMCYIADILNTAKPAPAEKSDGRGGGRGKGPRGKGGDSKKGSPWGLSPEEKAAKGKKPAAPAPKAE